MTDTTVTEHPRPFDASEHPRDIAGRFAEKANTAPEVRLETARERHEAAIAAGAFATAYDNALLARFEEEYPDADHEDLRFGLDSILLDEGDYTEHERTQAAAELSRRLADGLGGVLADAADLRPGDEVDLSALRADADGEPVSTVEYVERYGGMVRIDIEGRGGALVVPDGTRVPTPGFTFRGKAATLREHVIDLAREGEIRMPRQGFDPRSLMTDYLGNAGIALDSLHAPQPIPLTRQETR